MSALTIATGITILIVALLHFYFLVLEMVLWTKPTGRRVFNLTPEFAEASKTLAANQGLYNGFLAAGLLWAAVAGLVGAAGHFGVQLFFLTCVIVAGIYGGATVNKRILIVQALPAMIALLLVFAGNV
jgi:putative membrane protein